MKVLTVVYGLNYGHEIFVGRTEHRVSIKMEIDVALTNSKSIIESYERVAELNSLSIFKSQRNNFRPMIFSRRWTDEKWIKIEYDGFAGKKKKNDEIKQSR